MKKEDLKVGMVIERPGYYNDRTIKHLGDSGYLFTNTRGESYGKYDMLADWEPVPEDKYVVILYSFAYQVYYVHFNSQDGVSQEQATQVAKGVNENEADGRVAVVAKVTIP